MSEGLLNTRFGYNSERIHAVSFDSQANDGIAYSVTAYAKDGSYSSNNVYYSLDALIKAYPKAEEFIRTQLY